VDKFVAASKAIKIGLPREEDCRMSPLVHTENLKTVTDYVESGKKEGATLLCGGNVISDGELALTRTKSVMVSLFQGRFQ